MAKLELTEEQMNEMIQEAWEACNANTDNAMYESARQLANNGGKSQGQITMKVPFMKAWITENFSNGNGYSEKEIVKRFQYIFTWGFQRGFIKGQDFAFDACDDVVKDVLG